ncbi:MAG: acetoin utilization protein AcuC [Chloroflexota bacterium]
MATGSNALVGAPRETGDTLRAESKCNAVLVYGQEYSDYNFGPEHPLQPIRLRLTYELIKALDLLTRPDVALAPPRKATDEELALIHHPNYIRKAQELSVPGAKWYAMDTPFGLGTEDNPVFDGMHDAAAYSVGGSLVASELVMEGRTRHSFNVGGGLHHALPARASGFCVYNDAAIAITSVRQKYGCRVLYVDIDAHHGDGVQDAFYQSPEVLTISLHESGRYLFPGSGDVHEVGRGPGYGYSINLPFEPLTFDQVYLEAFREIVPAAARAFRPDVIVSQMGCDAHWNDPLAHLLLTMDGFRTIYREVHALAHELCEGRWIALGGGGYQLHTVVPKAWALLFAEMCDVAPDDEVPHTWLSLSQRFEKEPVSLRFKDERVPRLPERRVEAITTATQAIVEYLKRTVLPEVQ